MIKCTTLTPIVSGSKTVPVGELALWLAESAGITTEHAQWIEHFAARVALGKAHNGPARASKPKKDAGEQRHIKRFPKRLQTSRLDYELKEFTARAWAEAAAPVNAAEPPPTETSENRPPPAPYELDDRMCFGTRETIGVRNAHTITKEFLL